MLRALLPPAPSEAAPPVPAEAVAALAQRLEAAGRARLGRSLALRVVDTGSCGGCELEIAALEGTVHDLERFGLCFVESPRQADVLLVTGPVCRNLREAAEFAFGAMAAPRWVVAVGDCALDGGVFKGSYAVEPGGAQAVLPVDLVIRGCPPSPAQLLEGLLALIEAQDVPPRGRRASPGV
ncbi:NADH-quinone oxidoreductase subunit B family protein [Caldovatus aquaticus]|uniref:Hydrogenase n=1 Tax=Caldovatus aquaticus TaxID=2865671 RepID=A0ABS7F2S2_9PROT|nr:hydrogenase [Caldovatus aquaticus]MBW8269121.1 hydrogenase [Caldovatus aquaticus]